ncbi:MAG: O-antigen ligase family protein [Blautia sp.]
MQKRISQIYCYLMLGVFPLFFTNYYYNIQISKSIFFQVLTFLTAGVSFVLWLYGGKKEASDIVLSDVLFLLFAIVSVLSAALSPYGMDGFTGKSGRYIGALFLLAGCLCYSITSGLFTKEKNNKEQEEMLRLVFYTAGTVVEVLGILHFLGVNVLGFLEQVPEIYQGMYLSTLGYINVYAGFCMIVTVSVMAAYCLSGKKLLLVLVFVGFLGLFAGNSDGGFLGFFLGFFLIFLFLSKEKETQTRFWKLLFLFFISGISAFFLEKYGVRSFTGIPSLLSRPQVAFGAILISMVLRRGIKKKPKITGSAGIAAGVILLLLSGNRMVFDDTWGSNRGYIWRKILEAFNEAPIIRKLLGYGPDTLKQILESSSGEMLEKTGALYDSAHNDVLQYLITTGILGTVIWIGCFWSVCMCGWKCGTKEVSVWLFPFICYFAWSLINVSQPVITPLYFFMAGMIIYNFRSMKQGS